MMRKGSRLTSTVSLTVLGETADDGVDGFFEDRFRLELVDGSRGGTTARLDRVVVVVVVMMMVRCTARAGGSRRSRCRRHPTRRLVRPPFDGFRAIDDRIAAAATWPGYWPSGLVMLHHPVTIINSRWIRERERRETRKTNNQNTRKKTGRGQTNDALNQHCMEDIVILSFQNRINPMGDEVREQIPSGRYESARCNDARDDYTRAAIYSVKLLLLSRHSSSYLCPLLSSSNFQGPTRLLCYLPSSQVSLLHHFLVSGWLKRRRIFFSFLFFLGKNALCASLRMNSFFY